MKVSRQLYFQETRLWYPLDGSWVDPRAGLDMAGIKP